jgi:hypothetical protein
MRTDSGQGPPISQVHGLSRRSLQWAHWQRLAERELRRWGFALSGLVLGFWGVGLAQSQVSEDHERAAQAVALLHQQLSALPAGLSSPSAKALSPHQQNMLASLPGEDRQGQIWADLQAALTGHGLRLLSLHPLPPSQADAVGGRLPSQAVAVRLLGRFEDWSGVWSGLTQVGPVCSLDRVSMVATANPAEVQIDAVLRIWIRPGAVGAHTLVPPDGGWIASALTAHRKSGHQGPVLFEQVRGLGAPADQSTPNGPVTAAASGATLGDANAEIEDPRQWPLARVRLMGLWQQGADRQAILSAGPHWARVTLGQRVTQQGHRVAAITDAGVSLSLAQGPLLALDWDERRDKSKDGEKR